MKKLDAVNRLLKSVASGKVSTLTTVDTETQNAIDTLEETSLRVQSKGWYFNKERMKLTPTTNNEIRLPNGTLSVIGTHTRDRYIQRDGKLYDRLNNTFTITSTVEVDIVIEQNFEDIPHTCAEYITNASVYDFFLDYGGEKHIAQHLYQKMIEAQSAAFSEQFSINKVNIQNSPMGSDLFGG